jgi:hypothetical protein
MRIQRRTWVAERIGWAAFTLLVAAAAAGLFGAGPLARTEAASPDGGLRLRFERFARTATETGLTVEVAAAAPAGGMLRLRLGPELGERYQLARVWPEPARMLPAADGTVLEFAAEAGGGPARVQVWLKPDRPGWVASELALADGPPALFRQLVYP